MAWISQIFSYGCFNKGKGNYSPILLFHEAFAFFKGNNQVYALHGIGVPSPAPPSTSLSEQAALENEDTSDLITPDTTCHAAMVQAW